MFQLLGGNQRLFDQSFRVSVHGLKRPGEEIYDFRVVFIHSYAPVPIFR